MATMIEEHPELLDWLLGIVNDRPTKAGSFLSCLANAALRADGYNLQILLPALKEIQEKYPKYSFKGA